MNYFFDNCIALRFAAVLRVLDRDVVHLTEFEALAPSTLDVDWMPRVARAGRIVVTGDRRILKRPHERLLREALLLTTVFLPKGYVNGKMWQQLEQLVHFWPHIEASCERSRRGDCFEVSQSGKVSLFVP